MTWQVASFLLLAAALLTGFAWYERSHPSARVLALVGTLAALAVLGRIAFAAIPNVKPTTDIVLLAGYVFGGAPGFAVGAVSALASNVFFTQGPWTPWQMLAWGAIGIFGALLARAGGGRLGRLPLALACGLCGLFFGLVINFGTVVTVGDQDVWTRYLAYQSLSLPWDLAHAAGNVAFFYLFGPALVRTLRRFRTRLEFSWAPAATGAAAAPGALAARRSAPLALLLVLLGVASFAGGGLAAPPGARAQSAESGTGGSRAASTRPDAATAEAVASKRPADAATRVAASDPAVVAYLRGAQNRDGGFGGAPGQSSVDLFSGWTGLGLAAQGANPRDVRRPGGRSVIDYVRSRSGALTRGRGATSVGDLERTIMLVAAAGLDPRAFAGEDLVASLRARIGRDGSIMEQSNLTAFGLLALRSAGVPRATPQLRRAAAWLARQQNDDGGFGFATRGGGSDVDDAAAAVQALVATGGHAATVRRAVAFLRRNQNADGGFPLLPGGSSNAQSTGWAIQGLLATGTAPEAVRRGGSRSAPAYLRSLIGAGGVVQFSRSSRQTPVWVSGSSAIALAGRSFPLPVTARGAGAVEAAAAGDRGGGEDASGDGPSISAIAPLVAAIGVGAGIVALVVRRR